MKTLLRKDLKVILPSRVMAVIAFLVLQLALLPAVFMKKEAWIVTTLKCMIFVTVAMILFFVYEGANLFLKNIQKQTYFQSLSDAGVPVGKVLLFKQLITWITVLLTTALFIGGFALDTLLIAKKYPVVRKELQALDLSSLLGDVSGGKAIPALLAVLNLAFVLGVTVALAYFSVSLTYVFFTKQRFAGLSCIFVFLTFYLLIMSVDARLLGGLTSVGGRAAAVLVYFVLLLALAAGHRYFFRRKLEPLMLNRES